MGLDPPRPIVPVAAASFTQLRGRRVIVGVPGIGFRGDLRADDPVVSGSRTFVPVLTEQDYYRAETEQIEVFAPLVPVDRVWVEDLVTDAKESGQGATLDSPPRHDPIPARSAPRTMGRRVIRAVPDGHVRDLRATTDVYVNLDGASSVRVCHEPDWYGWALRGATPPTEEVRAETLWLE